MALKDIWYDKVDKSSTQSGDIVKAKDINDIAHAVIANEENILKNTRDWLALRNDIDGLMGSYDQFRRAISNLEEIAKQHEEDIVDLNRRISGVEYFGVKIDLNQSDPETSVTYIHDAKGMTPGSAEWAKTSIFKNIKPCLFKDGKVVGYLNPNNFEQFENGSEADLSGSAGNVMIEIPKLGYKIEINSMNELTVVITAEENVEGFSYSAHARNADGDRDKLYIAAYIGTVASNRLQSRRGNPTDNRSLNDFRAAAQANGAGYDVWGFYQIVLLQCLFLLKYKTLNSQAALGMGVVSDTVAYTVGGTFAKGMDFNSGQSGREHMKFLGIEDLWGNLDVYVDGVHTTGDLKLNVALNDYADWQSYKTYAQIYPTEVTLGYASNVHGTNSMGFLPRAFYGSTSANFCDAFTLGTGAKMRFGGNFSSGANAGIFNMIFSGGGQALPNVGARLMYL